MFFISPIQLSISVSGDDHFSGQVLLDFCILSYNPFVLRVLLNMQVLHNTLPQEQLSRVVFWFVMFIVLSFLIDLHVLSKKECAFLSSQRDCTMSCLSHTHAHIYIFHILEGRL